MRSPGIFLLAAFSCAAILNAQESGNMNFIADDLNGEPVALNDCLKRGPVFITFWATWCVPCRSELNVLQALQQRYAARGLTILAINRDAPKSLVKVKSFVKSQRYTMTVLLDPNDQIFKMLNGAEIPFSVLINRKGEVVQRRTGYFPGDERKIEEEISRVISAND